VIQPGFFLKDAILSKRILVVREIPEDLRLCMSDAHLADLAELAARQVSVECSWLLALVAYFYATGEFSSEEIERSLAECPLNAAAELNFGNADFAAAIRHFRRVHRVAIEEALELVFRGAQPFAPVIEIQNEARSRIHRAIQTDCWALDD
jgi:hypothetical protein